MESVKMDELMEANHTLSMDKQSRIFFKSLGLILLILLTIRAFQPDYPNVAAGALGVATGMMFCILFQEFQ